MFQGKSMIVCRMVITVVVLISGPQLYAQSQQSSGELKESERSSIMFDVNLKRLRDNSMMKDFDLKEIMKQQNIPDNEDFDITKVNRIFGSAQIPDDPAAMQPQPGKDLESNFFVRFEFADASAANQMIDSYKKKESVETVVDGKTYYSPAGGVAPGNLRIHLADDNTVEMGTERYVLHKDRNVISKSLADYWQQLPKDAAVRLCVDIESNRGVVDQVMEQAKTTAPPSAEPFLKLIDDLAALSIGFDLQSPKMLMFRAVGKDSEGTEKLRTGIDGMLGVGKFTGMQGLNQAPIDEDSRKIFGEMLKSLKTTAEGNTVKVDVVKPEGFDDTIGKMIGGDD